MLEDAFTFDRMLRDAEARGDDVVGSGMYLRNKLYIAYGFYDCNGLKPLTDSKNPEHAMG